MNDRDCLRRPMIFDSACRFDCPTGYKFNASRSQSSTWYCGINGKWIGQNQVCEGRVGLMDRSPGIAKVEDRNAFIIKSKVLNSVI